MSRFTLGLLLCLWAPALAVQVTLAGTVESWEPQSRVLVLKMESGTRTAHLLAGCPTELLQPGRKVAVRLRGAVNDDPVQVDLVVEWSRSAQYVAHSAPGPYYTPMGDYPTTNGVGGSSPGMPSLTQPDHVIGVLANGGRVADSVSLQARVLEVDRASGTLTVQAPPGSSPQMVVAKGTDLSQVQAGQAVFLNAVRNPESGLLEATSLVPVDR